MTAIVTIKVNKELYERDPEETELGKKIVQHSIILIDRIGFEQFTFKKLSAEISSTEASVYRYFQNKNQLLNYLVAWFWNWVSYLTTHRSLNIEDPKKRLSIFIQVLVDANSYDATYSHVDEALLHRIVMAESARVLMSKQVESDKQRALFNGYSSLLKQIKEILTKINPKFKHPKALTTTIITTAQEQIFFAENYPNMTEMSSKNKKTNDIQKFVEQLAFNQLGSK